MGKFVYLSYNLGILNLLPRYLVWLYMVLMLQIVSRVRYPGEVAVPDGMSFCMGRAMMVCMKLAGSWNRSFGACVRLIADSLLCMVMTKLMSMGMTLGLHM